MSLSCPGMSYLPVLESGIPLAFARRAQVWVGRVEGARLETVRSYSVCGDASRHQSPGEELSTEHCVSAIVTINRLV